MVAITRCAHAAYRADLEDFRASVGVANIGEAAGQLLSVSHGEANAAALAYKAHLVDRGLQAATINRRLAALRSLVKLAKAGVIKKLFGRFDQHLVAKGYIARGGQIVDATRAPRKIACPSDPCESAALTA